MRKKQWKSGRLIVLKGAKKILKKKQFTVEDVFGDCIRKDSFSQEQITKSNSFLNQSDVIFNFCVNISLFYSGKKKECL